MGTQSDLKETGQLRPRLLIAAVFAVGLVPVVAFLAPVTAASLPVHTDLASTVPMFNAWTAWWNAESIGNREAYWDAPIFAPASSAFAFSEPQPFSVVVAPLLSREASPALAHNAYLALAYGLNALAVTLVSMRRQQHRFCWMLPALFIIALPILGAHRHVVQLVHVWPVIWSWSALHRAIIGQSSAWNVSLGLAVGLSFATCVHHGLLNAIVVAPLALVGVCWRLRTADWSRSKRLICSLAVNALVAGILAAPIIMPIAAASDVNDFERSAELVTRLSAQPEAFGNSPGSLLWAPAGSIAESRMLYPGVGLCVLALIGAFGRGEQKSWRVGLVCVASLSFVLSFGGHLRMRDWSAWDSLCDFVPGLSQVRNVYRFAFCFQISLVLLSGFGLQRTLSVLGTFRRRSVCRLVSAGLVGFILFAIADAFPRASVRAGVPPLSPPPEWTTLVASQTDENALVLCLPMPEGPRVINYQSETTWMYYGTAHKRRLVNGYSGFFPTAYHEVRKAMTSRAEQTVMIRQLFDSGLRTIVVDKRQAATPAFPPDLHIDEFSTNDGVSVYTLTEIDAKVSFSSGESSPSISSPD